MDLDETLEKVRNEYDADLIVFTGPIVRPYDDRLIDEVKTNRTRKNVLLILTTFGGDPTAGYRIARCLQRNYENVITYVNSSCFSAGTMITLGAGRMIIDEHAELGPIDVQIRHKDEIGERVSGLTSRSALSLAADETPQTFGRIFLRLRKEIGLSTKLAAEIGATLTDSTIGKLFQQIDPMRLAEDSRSVKIIEQYAERIVTKNVREGAIHALINNYPDHSFVIDPEEAGIRIFHKTEKPSESLAITGERIKLVFGQRLYADDPVLLFLVPPTAAEPETEEPEENEQDSPKSRVSNGVEQDENQDDAPSSGNTASFKREKVEEHTAGTSV